VRKNRFWVIAEHLEAFAVEEATRLVSPEQIVQLEQVHCEMVDIARAQMGQAFILKDLDLHEKIWEFSGNEYVAAALRRSVYPIFAFSAIRIASCTPFDLLQDAYSHLPLVEAIKAKDPWAAREAFLSALDVWISTMRGSLFVGEPSPLPVTMTR